MNTKRKIIQYPKIKIKTKTNPTTKKHSIIQKPFLLLVILTILISLTNCSVGGAAAEPTAVVDWEVSHYNKTGICESIKSPKTESECFSQTNETHSCCLVKLNGTYADPTIIELYPAPAVNHRLRLLGGAAAAAPDPHSAASAEEENKNQFKKCVGVYKSEKAVASLVRKYKYDGMLVNSYFVCNTTQMISPCGMANPGKFEDCKSHSSAKKKCCLVNYLEMQTCELDLGLPLNNSNHLGVSFKCDACSLRFNYALVLFVFLGLGIGVFV